jgi:hypothetical protein
VVISAPYGAAVFQTPTKYVMSISKSEFARRRKNLMALMEPNSIAIIPA